MIFNMSLMLEPTLGHQRGRHGTHEAKNSDCGAEFGGHSGVFYTVDNAHLVTVALI